MDYSKITLGELLSGQNEIIRKHALGILKQLQNYHFKPLTETDMINIKLGLTPDKLPEIPE